LLKKTHAFSSQRMTRRTKNLLGAITAIIITAFVLIQRMGSDPYAIKDFERDPEDLVFTKHARCRMDCRFIDEEEVKQILVEGKINYRKSQPKAKPDPKYALEGITRDGQNVRVVFAPDKGKIVVITVIDLGKDWPCACD
jgi:hypothetical protein